MMKLKQCPMCGGTSEFKELSDQDLYVECSRCHLSTGFAIVEKCDRHVFIAGMWNSRVPTQAEYVIGAIHRLRSAEGSSVTICCSNPDPETREDQEAVDVTAPWTNWLEKRFKGETLEEALGNALAAMEVAK